MAMQTNSVCVWGGGGVGGMQQYQYQHQVHSSTDRWYSAGLRLSFACMYAKSAVHSCMQSNFGI